MRYKRGELADHSPTHKGLQSFVHEFAGNFKLHPYLPSLLP